MSDDYISPSPQISGGTIKFAVQTNDAGVSYPLSGGTTGTDWSSGQDQLFIPNIGQTFSSGPYNGYVLISTVPANPGRAQIRVENNSGQRVIVILDDGTASEDAAPINPSLFVLDAQGLPGSQSTFSGWKDNCERGRIQVYAQEADIQVMVREN